MPTATATQPVARSPGMTVRRATRHVARELAMLTGERHVVVVVASPLDGTELDRYAFGGALPAVDGDALLALVLPTEATVCDTARLHEPSLRRLARHWRTDRVLVAPCTFGHDLVALAIAPLAIGVPSHEVEPNARRLTERFAASVIATRLFANASAALTV